MCDEYEWDESKRKQTIKLRGLDFADISHFDWETSLTNEDCDSATSEDRFITIGYLGESLIVVVWCYRDEKTRIISMRKAERKERRRFSNV